MSAKKQWVKPKLKSIAPATGRKLVGVKGDFKTWVAQIKQAASKLPSSQKS